MLAAVVAAAAVLGDCFESEIACGITNYTKRWECDGLSYEMCCPAGIEYWSSDCYSESESPCAVSYWFKCCGSRLERVECDSRFNETECKEKPDYEWCEPPITGDPTEAPAPPAEEPGLSAGATAGIVVGGILGPFALGLAYKSLMYK